MVTLITSIDVKAIIAMMTRAMTILTFESSSVHGNVKDAYPNDVDHDEDNCIHNLAPGLNEKLNA